MTLIGVLCNRRSIVDVAAIVVAAQAASDYDDCGECRRDEQPSTHRDSYMRWQGIAVVCCMLHVAC